MVVKATGQYDLTKAESRWRKGKEKSPEHSNCYRSGRRGRTSKRLKRSDQGDRRKTKRGLSWKPKKCMGGGAIVMNVKSCTCRV